MLKLSINKLLLFITGAFIISSCEKIKDFGDTNVNPAAIADPVTANLLTRVEAGLGGIDGNAAYYCQYFTNPAYDQDVLYTTKSVGLGDYSGALMDLNTIIFYNTDQSKLTLSVSSGAHENQIAIARILKAYIFWKTTDALGDIPYTEALKGQEELFYPKYDRQEDIYKDLIKELTEAVDGFDNSTAGVKAVQGDVIYDGDREKWKKFTNSLRMLMAVRLSKKYPGAGDYAAAEFKKALAHPSGIITANADNFTINFPGAPYVHPLASESQDALSKTFTDLLSGTADDRIKAFGGQSYIGPGNFISSSLGVPYGIRDIDGRAFTGANPLWARTLMGLYRQGTSPLVLIGAANLLLAKAEGIERGWKLPDPANEAEQDYDNAIAASFEQWSLQGFILSAAGLTNTKYNTGVGVAQIGVNSYNSIPVNSSAATTAKLDRIHLQQYIAWFPNAAQAWADWRRTGFPNLQPTAFAINTSKQIPRRYIYSSAQYATNGDQVRVAVSRLPGAADNQDARVWWDQ